MHAYNQVGVGVVWQAPKEVSMIHQLADGFFLSKRASLGAQNIPVQCVSTDQPPPFTLCQSVRWVMARSAGGGW